MWRGLLTLEKCSLCTAHASATAIWGRRRGERGGRGSRWSRPLKEFGKLMFQYLRAILGNFDPQVEVISCRFVAGQTSLENDMLVSRCRSWSKRLSCPQRIILRPVTSSLPAIINVYVIVYLGLSVGWRLALCALDSAPYFASNLCPHLDLDLNQDALQTLSWLKRQGRPYKNWGIKS